MAIPVSEPFEQANFTPLSANWTVILGTPQINTGVAVGTTSAYTLAYWNADTFTDDQYAQAVLGYTAFRYPAVACRVSGTNLATAKAYMLVVGSSVESAISIQKFAGSTNVSLVGAVAASTPEHTYKLTAQNVSGAVVLNGYDNGVLVATYTDSSSPYLTGQPGIFAYDTGAWNDFFADNIGAPPPPPPVIGTGWPSAILMGAAATS